MQSFHQAWLRSNSKDRSSYEARPRMIAFYDKPPDSQIGLTRKGRAESEREKKKERKKERDFELPKSRISSQPNTIG